MTDNFNDENKDLHHKPHWTDGNNKTLKFFAICLSAFLGGFLAVFAVSGIMMLTDQNQTPHYRPMPPVMPINLTDEKFFDNINDDFELPDEKPPIPPQHKPKHIVNVEETPNSYKVYINLRKFNNDEKNINVNVKPHSIKVSGNATVNNKNEQSSFSYSQELTLSRKVDIEKVSKEKIGNRYVITLPIKEH